MAFIKRNLLFCIVVAISVSAFTAGAYLTYQASGKVAPAKSQLSSARAQLSSLENAAPAPTPANVSASEENIERLLSKLSQIREDLQRGSRLRTSTDGVSVMTSIQQYISDFQRAVARHIGPDGTPDPIEIEPDFAFGFEQYIDEATPLDDPAKIRRLDQQRQILNYLVNQLIQSDPDSIESVQRELLESTKEGEERPGFKISPAISARVPGAIDTMAFRLTFTGYTTVLRNFLNNLAKPELPIVVRGIEVERPSGRETIAAPSLDDPFGGMFGELDEGRSPSGLDSSAQEAQEPVISENISRFTVIVEFIEIVLPSDADAEPSSDPV